jgi:hypothetical protein
MAINFRWLTNGSFSRIIDGVKLGKFIGRKVVMEYKCEKCGMGVKELVCSKCDAPLVHETIVKNGQKIHVAKCPSGCGMIKSPTCCGQDMECAL